MINLEPRSLIFPNTCSLVSVPECCRLVEGSRVCKSGFESDLALRHGVLLKKPISEVG